MENKRIKHGTWIEETDGRDKYYVCSKCREDLVLWEGNPKQNGYKFCPFCGDSKE